MSKFKVGDRVRVKNVEVGSFLNGAVFVDSMRCLCGLEGTVTCVRSSDGLVVVIDFGGPAIDGKWSFADAWLELVDEVSKDSEVSEVSERASEVESCGLDLVKLLRGHEGISLWSPICGECVFEHIDENSSIYPIRVVFDTVDKGSKVADFTVDGKYFSNCPDSECVLWPSHECRTWDGWVAPRWRAEKGKCYFFISSEFELSLTSDMYGAEDTKRWEVGNYFKREAACEAALEKMKGYLSSQEK